MFSFLKDVRQHGLVVVHHQRIVVDHVHHVVGHQRIAHVVFVMKSLDGIVSFFFFFVIFTSLT